MTEITPVHALKALIINEALRYSELPAIDFSLIVDGDEVDYHWDSLEESHPDSLYDAQYSIRTSGRETGLATPISRNYEPDAVAVLTPFNQWVGFIYWHGGGKHSNPEEIDWIEDAYWVECEVDSVVSLKYKFSSPDGKPAPFVFDDIEDTHQRLAAINNFCKQIPTESMIGHSVFSWIDAECNRIMEEAAKDSETTPLKPILAFKKAFGEGPMSGIVASLFAEELLNVGAVNFNELHFNTPEVGDIIVTIQRKDGETPAQQRDAAKAQRDAAIERRDEILTQLKDAVSAWEAGNDVSGSMSRARWLIDKFEG